MIRALALGIWTVAVVIVGSSSGSIAFARGEDVTVTFEPSTRTRLGANEAYLRRAAAHVANIISLPEPVPVVFEECGGDENAYWLGVEKRVKVCYDLVRVLAKSARKYAPEGGNDLVRAFRASLVFVMFHEIGHAYVDLAELPVTGSEEDTVDQFAAFVMEGAGPTTQGSVAVGSAVFFSDLRGTGGAWRKHAPSQQRVTNALCLAWGSNYKAVTKHVTKIALLVDNIDGMEEFLGTCDREWQSVRRFWKQHTDVPVVCPTTDGKRVRCRPGRVCCEGGVGCCDKDLLTGEDLLK